MGADRRRLVAAFASAALAVVGLGLGSVPAAAFQSTGDGSWIWQNPLPEGNLIVSVSCPAVDTCVALERKGGLLRTTDTGTTWSWVSSGGIIFNGVSCPDISTCYAVGDNGTILKTTTGTTWVNQDSGTTGRLTSISCANTTTCFVGGNPVEFTTDGAPIGSTQVRGVVR